MKSKKDNYINQSVITGIMVISIAFIAFLTYSDILGYFFTGIDALAIIDSSRIQSFDDVIRIFSEPLGSGTPMPERVQKCFRPIVALSYTLDHYIWKLNPSGYHLTNLILHILVSITVFFFINVLTNGNKIMSLLGAVIFAIHPLHVETIPASPRRFDTITALFMLLSLLLFIKYNSMVLRKRSYLLFSLIFCALALGSKEIAVILPVLILTYSISASFTDDITFKDKAVYSLKKSLPYFILTFMYLGWRTYILKGMGGYVPMEPGMFEKIQVYIGIVSDYFIVLPYPVDFFRLELLFSPFSGSLKQAIFAVILAVIITSMFLKRRAILKVVSDEKRWIENIKILIAAFMILSILCIFIYPVISPHINYALQKAYDGEGFLFIADEMNNIGAYPVETYFYKTRDLFLRIAFILLIISTVLLACIHNFRKMNDVLKNSSNARLMLFLLSWLPLPLVIYMVGKISGRYYLYISVIPFSIILSVMLVYFFQSAVRIIRENSLSAHSFRFLFFNGRAGSFMVLTGLAISLLLYSPLISSYGEWKESGNISKKFLHKLSDVLPELSDNAVLHIYNFPESITSYRAEIPHARDITYINDYNIESWLNLRYPGNQLKVVMHERSKLKIPPTDLNLEVKNKEQNDVVIIVNYNVSNGT